MSKRVHEELQENPREESREDRWLRKMKFYEEKLKAKRQRRAESANNQILPADVQIEDHRECNQGLNAEPRTDAEYTETIGAEYSTLTDFDFMPPPPTSVNNDYMPPPQTAGDNERPGNEIEFEDFSQMSKTTAPPSPSSIPGEDNIGEFDPKLLRELGDAESEPAEYGDDLQVDVAARFQKILAEGLKKELKEEILKKYPFPKNTPLAKGPTLNPEIGAMLPETCKLRDKRLLGKQDQLGKTLSALGKALSGLLKKTPDIPDVIRTLNDAGKLLADSHYAETDTRRSVIIPLIDKSLTDPFKDRKRDSFLFGEKLGDLVKDSRGIKKTGQLIQSSTSSSSSNLNARGPSSRTARQQRGGQTFTHRAGGPRPTTSYTMAPAYYQYPYPYPNRRRAPPPPPPRRRQPAPPPPPPTTARRPQAPAQRFPTSR